MTNESRHHSHGNHHEKNYTHSHGRTKGSRQERSYDYAPRRTEESRYESTSKRAPLRSVVQPSGTETAIKFVGTIVKAIFKGSVQAIGEFGEYVAKNQEDFELAQARLRAKKQLIQQQGSQHNQPTWIRTSDGTIITVGTHQISSKTGASTKVDRRTATETVLGGSFGGARDDDTRTATERVLGGSFGDKARKGNKTATETIFGGRFER